MTRSLDPLGAPLARHTGRLVLVASLLPTALFLVGCKKDGAAETIQDPRTIRDTELVLEKCDTEDASTEKLDANGDGRPEIFLVKDGPREVCRRVDMNLDGKIDRSTFFDAGGAIRRIESDFDKDGIVDEIALFEGGKIKEKHRATMPDGKLDTWEFYKDGRLVGSERDQNGDGVIDQWWEYPTVECPMIHADADGDGRPDPGATIDYCKETGYVPPPPQAGPSGPTGFEAKGSGVVEELSNEPDGGGTGGTGSSAPAAPSAPAPSAPAPSAPVPAPPAGEGN